MFSMQMANKPGWHARLVDWVVGSHCHHTLLLLRVSGCELPVHLQD